jgi:hypothetical protein
MARPLAIAVAAGILGVGVATAGAVTVPAVAASVTGQPSPADVSSRVDAVRKALQGLVDDKTLTDQQADKVADTLGKSDGLRGPGPGPGGRHGFGLGIGGPEATDTLAKALGMSADDVRTALRNGTTIADLAKKQGKDVSAVESALVAAAKARLAEAVKAGRLTQAQADEIQGKLAGAIKQFVENGRPAGPRGFGPRHGWDGPGKDGGTPPAPSPSPTTSTSAFTTA